MSFNFNALSSFLPLDAGLSCTTQLTSLLTFVSFLTVRVVLICKVHFLQNISENEDLLFYSEVVIQKETFTENQGSFSQDFHKEFSEHDMFHKIRTGELSLNT